MNNRRNQQNHGYQQGNNFNRYQQKSYQRQEDPQAAERQQLKATMRTLRQRLTVLDVTIDTLKVQGEQIKADIQAHEQTVSTAILVI
jgi:hypothetical protein